MTLVGCAGILVSDTICGPMTEIPREGQLLAVDNMPTKSGGCAANVAIDLAKQGIPVDVAGCLGDDPSAGVLFRGLEDQKVGVSRIVTTPALPTSKTVILLVAGQDRRYIHSFGANAAFTVAHIDREWVRTLKVFYLGGLFLMPAFQLAEFIPLLQFCRENGVITIVDVVIPQNTPPQADLKPLLELVDYFLPNEDEALLLTGAADPLDQLRILRGWGANTVVITRGRNGAIAGSRNREFWQTGIYSIVDGVDPSGCGDAFAAGLISGIVNGADMLAALQYASALGASAFRALGTTDGVFNAKQAQEFIAHNHLEVQTGTF
jgi:sugar/nucleoside kinase (ribokinase family)